MAAYAALVSLLNTLDKIDNHHRLSNSFDKKQIESLREKIGFLLEFIESYSSHGGISNEEVEELEREIASAAHTAEDVIESHVVDQIVSHMAESTDHVESASSSMLVLLIGFMEIIRHPRFPACQLERKQIDSLGEKLDFFLDFVEVHDSNGSTSIEEVEDLRSQIAQAWDVAEGLTSDEQMFSYLLDFIINIMKIILNHPHIWACVHKKEIEVFREALEFMRYIAFFLERGTSGLGMSNEELESQIAEHGETCSSFLLDAREEINAMKEKTEKVLEKIMGQKVASAGPENSFLLDLQKKMEDMDSLEKKIIKVKERRGFKNGRKLEDSMPAASSRSLTTGKTTMVGFDGYLIQLLDRLIGEQSDRQIIPITGMGGIGKTTLARNAYDSLHVAHHFDVRAWVSVSQEYNVTEILYQALSCLVKSTEELDRKTEDELGEELHKIIFDRRYLITLDDMWSVEAWNKIRFFFPENGNRSRIVVTTRQSDVANYFGSLGLSLDFLDDNKSWELFCKKAFPQECCPLELESIGQSIVKKCRGLTLAIIVIGGLLGKSSRAPEYWANVGKDISSIVNSVDGNQCLNILSLSYSHLPVRLKPCFLYLGIFSEDQEIDVSRLIQLWIAEGILKPNKEKSLEEVAKDCINDLVDRNLVIVRRLSCVNGKVRTCNIHDLIRDLCIKIAEKEKFFCMIRELDTPRNTDRERRLITLETIAKAEHNPRAFHTLQSTSPARSVIGAIPSHFWSKSRLLRLLSDDYGDPLDIAFKQVNLRFLQYRRRIENLGVFSYQLPSSISLLWNLQTIIIRGNVDEVVAPSEIWETSQLRHLEFYRVYLSEPPLSNKHDRIVLKNLQTLKVASIFRCSEEVCKRMPNIKKLSLFFYDNLWGLDTLAYYCFYNIGCLNELESLQFDSREVPTGFKQSLKLPSSLKKLALQHCELHWDDLTVIGSLPRLEVLRLDWDAVIGPEWNPVDGQFQSLKYLQIYSCCDLICWNADKSHFPVLERLVLVELCKLQRLPLDIGEIPTLRDIHVDNCNVSAAISTIEIVKEQESLGNEGLQVGVEFRNKKEREEFKKKMEEDGFTSIYFKLL